MKFLTREQMKEVLLIDENLPKSTFSDETVGEALKGLTKVLMRDLYGAVQFVDLNFGSDMKYVICHEIPPHLTQLTAYANGGGNLWVSRMFLNLHQSICYILI